MFPSRRRSFPPPPGSPLLRGRRIRGSRGWRGGAPYPPNRCPTTPPPSAEILLREASAGTSYCRARLVFCPYSQVTGGICTSPSLSGLHRARDPASPCPGVDRPASGLTSVTEPPFGGDPLASLRGPRFRSAFGLKALRLATPVNSPARVSRRTGRPRSAPSYSCLAAFSFGSFSP